MAVALFFLLSGMFAAELALIGVTHAGVIGAALFLSCAAALGARARDRRPAAQRAPARDSRRASHSPVAVKP